MSDKPPALKHEMPCHLPQDCPFTPLMCGILEYLNVIPKRMPADKDSFPNPQIEVITKGFLYKMYFRVDSGPHVRMPHIQCKLADSKWDLGFEMSCAQPNYKLGQTGSPSIRHVLIGTGFEGWGGWATLPELGSKDIIPYTIELRIVALELRTFSEYLRCNGHLPFQA